jgi:hypothetical protein
VNRRHRHVCSCGDYFVCSQEPDKCQVGTWECPTCIDKQLDAYLSQLEPQPTEQEQELTHHEG